MGWGGGSISLGSGSSVATKKRATAPPSLQSQINRLGKRTDDLDTATTNLGTSVKALESQQQRMSMTQLGLVSGQEALRTELHDLIEEREREKREEEERLRQQALEEARRRELARLQGLTVVTNLNAIKVDFEYENGERDIKFYFAKQDKPLTEEGESDPIPIKADVFYIKNDLVTNNIDDVEITGSAKLQMPSIKSLVKDETDAKMEFQLQYASSVSVYFGFMASAGIAEYDIYEEETGEYFIASGTVDLHSTSDSAMPSVRGVELADNLDDTKNYTLEIRHSGGANGMVYSPGLDHKIYVGEIQIHRVADATNSVVEYISNDGFANNSYIDNGAQNSLTGRDNFVEFFEIQIDVADGITETFPIKTAVLRVRSVEIDNGRGFKELNEFIDWSGSPTDDNGIDIVLTFVPKSGAKLRIKYDTISSRLQRKIELNQPITVAGDYDRYTNMYLQNEACYTEIIASS